MQMPLFMANKQNCRRINISNQQQKKNTNINILFTNSSHQIYKQKIITTKNLPPKKKNNNKIAAT